MLFLLLLVIPANESQDFLPLGRPLLHCNWTGTAPFCMGRCSFDSFEILRAGEVTGQGDNFGRACIFGRKSLCCPRTKRLY